jgi:tRNA pseudouridine38-40 synthase
VKATAAGSRVLRLTLEYDGTDLLGWQLQARGRTVQGELERALKGLLGAHLRPTAAGRTDSGVHAQGQVVSLRLAPSQLLPLRAFVQGLNGLLPADVAVRRADWVDDDFDARRRSHGKLYRYRILHGLPRSPLQRRTHWIVYRKLAVPAMRLAAAHFVGSHDFAAFRAANCEAKTTRRRIVRFTVTGDERPGEVVIDVLGTAFLKQMVRNLVGTLVDVGLGRRKPEDMVALLHSRDRRKSGRTAPAQGLTLCEVYYEDLPE